MASYSIVPPPTGTEYPTGVRVVKWLLTSADPTGSAYIAPHRSDKSVHIFGTIGTATVALQGTNEPEASPTDWVTLSDPQGTAISYSSLTPSKLEGVLENPYAIRAALTTAGAGATVSVYLLISTVARR